MTGQDEREVLTVEQARVLLRRAWRCTCWSGNREECAKPVEQVERFLAGFHLTPTEPDADVPARVWEAVNVATMSSHLVSTAEGNAVIWRAISRAFDLAARAGLLTPTAEVKAEALAQIIEPLLAAHGTKARNAYYVECHCGCSEMGSYPGETPTLHEHKAQVIAEAIATHLRENGGA